MRLTLWRSWTNSFALALWRVMFGEAVVDVDLDWVGVVEVGWLLGWCLVLDGAIGDWAGETYGELSGVLQGVSETRGMPSCWDIQVSPVIISG